MSDWALCVGVGAYTSSSKLEPLPGALNDAKAIHDWIIDPGGGGVFPANAKLILSPLTQNEDLPDPAADAIERFLRARYREAEASRLRGDGFTAGRRLWLYFSGHGIGFPDDGNDTGLLAADALPPLRDYPHIAGKAWAELFRVTKAFDEVILFMDCCRLEITRTALRRPAVRELKADPPGKMLAAFAVSSSKAAFENDSPIHGVPRGKFTVALEELLRNRPHTAITARDFLDQLAFKAPDCDPLPMSPKNDFEFLPAPLTNGTPADAQLLIAHGEDTTDLASALAVELQTPDRSALVKWAPDVITDTNPEAYTTVHELVVTRDVPLEELRVLIARVRPRRTVVFSNQDPGVSDLPGVQYLQRPDTTVENLSVQANKLVEALKEPPGLLTVLAVEPMAKIRVWDERGHSAGSGFGNLDKLEVLPGKYHMRAALGSYYAEATTEVISRETHTITLPALPLRLPSTETLLTWTSQRTQPESNRSIYEGRIGGNPLYFSAPRISGWRLELFSSFQDRAADFSLRLVPDSHPSGTPHEMDAIRESLKLALSERSWDATRLAVEAVASDPVCALLAATLKLKCDLPHEKFTDAAAAVLGDEDIDVRLLRGEATIDDPPLLSYLWHFRLKRNELKVKPNSNADQIIGRLLWTEPWLTWTARTRIMDRSWLGEVANAVWPGWNGNDPDVELARANLALGASSLGAPADSLQRKTYKSPPVDRLVQHQEIAFVGASNDQLPAALAVAFVERGHKKWSRIDVWSLSDDHLKQVNSEGRTSDELTAARNRSEQQLQQLLKVVSEEWSIRRYGGLDVQYNAGGDSQSVWCFASLWDWSKNGGYVHVSPYLGENVRTADFQDLIWSGKEPPPVYQATVQAYKKLSPGELLGSS